MAKRRASWEVKLLEIEMEGSRKDFIVKVRNVQPTEINKAVEYVYAAHKELQKLVKEKGKIYSSKPLAKSK